MREDVKHIQNLIKQEEYTEAYKRLSKIDQDDLYVRGEYLLLEKLYIDLKDHINDPSLPAKLGRILYRQEKFTEAERYLIIASKKESNWLPFIFSVLGGMYLDLGRVEEAQDTLQKSIDESKKYKDIRTAAGTSVRLAKLLLGEGKEKEAETLILNSISLAKENNWQRDIHIWKGHLTQVLIAQGKSQQAKQILKEVLPYFIQNEDVKYRDMFKERLETLQ